MAIEKFGVAYAGEQRAPRRHRAHWRPPARSALCTLIALVSGVAFAHSATASPVITTVAGNGSAGDSGDGGLAIDAPINGPLDLVVDGAGNVYFATADADYRLRRVDAATGIITTYAGNGDEGFSADGSPATDSSVEPYGLAVDAAGNVFFSDLEDNPRVRRVDAVTRILTTVAGGGSATPGDGGLASASFIGTVVGLDRDPAGNLFLVDVAPYEAVRRVDAATGVISTVAGNGTLGLCADGVPATGVRLVAPYDVALDAAGNIVIAGNGCHKVYRVDMPGGLLVTLAGTGVGGFSGDGGAATAADLSIPTGVDLDPSGNLFIADQGNQRVRRVDVATGVITTVAGGGASNPGDGGSPTAAALGRLSKVAVTDGGATVYFADYDNRRIRRVGNCGNGTVESPEECDDGAANGVPGSCCTFNCRNWDNDGDGACDDTADVCMNAGGAQTIGGAVLSAQPGRLRMRGTLRPPADVPFDPPTSGVQLKMLDGAGQTALSVALPAGAYGGGGTKGWRAAGSGKVWKFIDSTRGSGPRLRMVIKRKTPSELRLKVVARNLSLALAPADLPLTVAAVFGGQVQAAGGQCGEAKFPTATCAFTSMGVLACEE